MTDMEKAQQIGELVTLREQQKQNVEHLKLKTTHIAGAYAMFGRDSSRWKVDPGTPQRVFLLHPKSEEREAPSWLLTQSELAEHIKEVEAAEMALATTTHTLNTLGIHGLA